MVEPVSGIHLINSAFEPAPAMTEKQKADTQKKRDDAINVVMRNKERKRAAAKKLKEAKKDAKKAAKKVLKASISEHFKPRKVFGVTCKTEEQAEAELKKQMAENSEKENEVTRLENSFNKKYARLIVTLSDYSLQKANVIVHGRNFALDRKKLRGAEKVELVMAACEDIPEIVLGIVFWAKGGLAGSTDADVSLFVTSMVVSLFHALKCFWAYYQLMEIIIDSKMEENAELSFKRNVAEWDGRLDTYRFKTAEGFFEAPMIEEEVENLANKGKDIIGKRLRKLRKPMDKANIPIHERRKDVNAHSDAIRVEATLMKQWSAEAKAALEELEARKKAEEDFQKRLQVAREADKYRIYNFRHAQLFTDNKMIPVVDAAMRKEYDEMYGRSKGKSKWAMLGSLPTDVWSDIAYKRHRNDIADQVKANRKSKKPWVKDSFVVVDAFGVKGPCGDCGMPVKETHEYYKDPEDLITGKTVYYHYDEKDCVEEEAWEPSSDFDPVNTNFFSDNKLFQQFALDEDGLPMIDLGEDFDMIDDDDEGLQMFQP